MNCLGSVLLGALLAALLTLTTTDRVPSAGSSITSENTVQPDCAPREKIAFTKTTSVNQFPNAEIYLMNPDGSEPFRVTTDGFFDGMPSISPDERGKIVFDSNRIAVSLGAPITTPRTDLFLINHDGTTDNEQLPTPLLRGSSATWSPDGKKLAFHRSNSGGTTGYGMRIPGRGEPGGPTIDSDIFTVNLDNLLENGEQPVNLTENFELNSPGRKSSEDDADWSRDGTKIAFTSRDSACATIASCQASAEIWVMNADGSNPTQLTSNSLEERSPDWSPDGTKILYMCRLAPETPLELCVMNADGTGHEVLTNSAEPEFTPGWSPDGTRIVFFRGFGGQQQVWVMNYLADENGDRHETPITTGDGFINLFPNWGTIAVGCGNAISHVLAAPLVVPGIYDLSFHANRNGVLEPVSSLPVLSEELILKAHVTNSEGAPAQDGTVIFEYCSYRRLPPNDLDRADEAPKEACDAGLATWDRLGRVTVDAGSCPGLEPGNACFNFGPVRIPRDVGFRFRYMGRRGGVGSGVSAEMNFTWTPAQ